MVGRGLLESTQVSREEEVVGGMDYWYNTHDKAIHTII